MDAQDDTGFRVTYQGNLKKTLTVNRLSIAGWNFPDSSDQRTNRLPSNNKQS